MTKKSNKAKSQEETKEELELRISEQMQSGFKRTAETWTVKQITDAVNKGTIHDAPYQRGNIWDRSKQKALVETILKYGGEKIPTITLRKLGDKDYEIVDGKQRLLTALTPYVNGEFGLKGVYNPELSGYTIKDLYDELRGVHASFMSCNIPLEIMEDMSDEDAITYFIQINSSGVNMTIGEKIHAMQGTPILKTLDSLKKHKVWGNITRKMRYNEYWHLSRMLLFSRDYEKNADTIRCYTQSQLLNELDIYRSIDMPKRIVKSVKETFDFLNKIFTKFDFKVTIAEFFSIFLYTTVRLSSLKNDDDFGKFISELYYHIYNYQDDRIFSVFKTRHNETGFKYTPQYYQWYIRQVDFMFKKFKNGESWDDIRRVPVIQG